MEQFIVTLTPKEHKRIFAKIAIDQKTKCWNWIGSLDQMGYGLLWYRGKTERIHRVLYSFFKIPIPKKDRKFNQIDHLCRNHGCCNPDHLEMVSQRENVRRGISPPAINAKKTHCKYGHSLPNDPNRGFCKVCDSIRHKIRRNGTNREYWLKKSREAARRYYTKHK